ncbi:MAG: MotA/TolQ/ExbB proton channel family protein [Deltaproteobacteria bacterium]|nr:MotA/TolQ/ExbB proton channel family protein [Deltaproteobacteria bacterium]
MNITERFLGFALLGAQWVMWLLVCLSIILITVMIERGIYFFGMRPDISSLVTELGRLLRVKDIAGARKLVEGLKGVAPAVAASMLEVADQGPAAAEEAAMGAVTRERIRLERNLVFLGTVGNNAPFIGLFGTVIGIIRSFHDLSLNTQGGAGTVMAGISEALVATAIGLLVAIPAVVAFNVLQRRIKTLLADADVLGRVVLAGLKGHVAGGKE